MPLTPEQAIEQLIKRLDAIAKKNDDEFSYRLDLNLARQGIRYLFICEETADNHSFVSGHGASIEAAVADAAANIEHACGEWGYELP